MFICRTILLKSQNNSTENVCLVQILLSMKLIFPQKANEKSLSFEILFLPFDFQEENE